MLSVHNRPSERTEQMKRLPTMHASQRLLTPVSTKHAPSGNADINTWWMMRITTAKCACLLLLRRRMRCSSAWRLSPSKPQAVLSMFGSTQSGLADIIIPCGVHLMGSASLYPAASLPGLQHQSLHPSSCYLIAFVTCQEAAYAVV